MGDNKMKWAKSPSPVDRAGAPTQQPSGSRLAIIPKEKDVRSLTEHCGSVFAICFWASKERGNILISGCMDSTMKAWSLDKHHSLHTMRGHSDAVRCLAVSKHEHPSPMVLSGGDDAKLNLWSLLTGKLLHTLKGHHGPILSIALCHDDRHPIAASAGRDKAIRLWNVNSGEFMFLLQGHEQPVTSLEISARYPPVLLSGSHDRSLRVWELSSGRFIRKIDGHMGRITCVAMSKDPNAATIVVSADTAGAVVVWDLKNYKRLFTLIEPTESGLLAGAGPTDAPGTHSGSTGEISSVALSSSCENLVIITSTWGAAVKVWDARSGGLLRVLDGARFSRVHRVLVCCDAVSALVAVASEDGTIYLSSPEDDYNDACRSVTSLREMSIEASLALVGKYITYVRLLEDVSEHTAVPVNRRPLDSNNRVLTIVFYCMIRFATVNPSFFLANVDVTSSVLSQIIDLVDLLFVDRFVGVTAMQFLLERRVCIGRAQDWIRIEKNQKRVMAFLGDKLQSSDTLDCVLSALVTDNTEGWDVLISHVDFPHIFENLMLHSPRSHSKLAYLISKYGLYVEAEPFHIPYKVAADKEFTTCRIGQAEYDSLGVHCYRVRMRDRLQSEFYMTHKFLDALVRSESVEELVAAPLVDYVLSYRWDTWGYYATVNLGLLHILYCLSAMSAVFCICSVEYDECRVKPTHAISVSIVVFINTLYMGLAALQFRMATDVWSFVTNFWCVFEVIMVGMCHVCILLGTALGPIFIIRQLCALFALMLWAWLPYFGRGSFGLASLLHQMRIIIWEVRYFVCILLLFNCAFAVAFRLLDIYESVWHASIRCFNMMVGDVHYDFFLDHTFAEILYMVFLISVAIILLNSLIAFMEGSLGNARRKERIASKISRAQFVCELEVRLLPFNRIAALFSSSEEETLQEYLSPSAMLMKDAARGGDSKEGRRSARSGAQNELIVLFPESFGMPPFSTVDDISAAIEMQKIGTPVNKSTSVVELDAGKEDDNNTDRLEQLELHVSSLDKKLDLILGLMSRPDVTPQSAASNIRAFAPRGVNLDDDFSTSSLQSTPLTESRDRTYGQAPMSGAGSDMGSTSAAVARSMVGGTAITPLSTGSTDELISYSYFGAAEEDVQDPTVN